MNVQIEHEHAFWTQPYPNNQQIVSWVPSYEARGLEGEALPVLRGDDHDQIKRTLARNIFCEKELAVHVGCMIKLVEEHVAEWWWEE